MVPPGEPSDITSTSLLVRVRADDPLAWVRLLHVYRPLVVWWVARHFDEAQPEHDDIVQEVFLAVHRAVGGFRRDRPGDSFRGWLRAIAHNKIVDAHRRRRDRPRAAGGSHFRDIEDDRPADLSVDEAEEVDDICRRAVEVMRTDFEERTWKAFWLTRVEGRGVEDVARELGMTATSVRTYRARVLARLKAELGDLEPEF